MGVLSLPGWEAGCVQVAGCVAQQARKQLLRSFQSGFNSGHLDEGAVCPSEHLASVIGFRVSQRRPELWKQSPQARRLALCILTSARGAFPGLTMLGNIVPFIPGFCSQRCTGPRGCLRGCGVVCVALFSCLARNLLSQGDHEH